MKLPNWVYWLARDEDGELWAYSEKPFKSVDMWDCDDYPEVKREIEDDVEDIYNFIKWTDEEPTEVKRVLKTGGVSMTELNRITSAKAHGYDEVLEVTDMINNPNHYKQGGLETLLQEWINESKSTRIDDLRKMTTSDFVPVEKLKNLLVPNQEEITEEEVMEWLDNNDFYDHKTAETVLANAVDKGELVYYGTKYIVIEKPVIPQFVADWIDVHNLHGNNPLREYRDLESDFNEGWTDEKDAEVYHWAYKNPYAFIDALRYGYEVEKEILWEIPMPDLKTSDGHNQYLTYDPKARTYFASRQNGRLKQTFDAKDLASVPGQYRRYAELCDFKKIEEVTE